MDTNSNVRLTGLAKRLVEQNKLPQETAVDALAAAQKDKVSFVQHLVSKKILPASELAQLAALEFGFPLFDLGALEPNAQIANLVDEKLIRHHRAVPIFKRGKRLFVAISDPSNIEALDEFQFNTGLTTDAVLVEDNKLDSFIERALEANSSTAFDNLDTDLENLDISDGTETEEQDVGKSDADDAPIVKYVNKILLDAINKGASDIHFEVYEKFCRFRFRTDGVLHEVAKPPMNQSNRIVARIKVMSNMDIAEKRVPQDGRIKLKLSKTRAIDFRVNSCPTLFGEKIVLRILDPSSAKLGIDALGYEDVQKQIYMDNLAKPYGMILVTGPTGSGKTVSLYTGLNILNTEDVNISTAEDPAEINLPGINQVNVNPKAGLTFASALRAFLRQDPDVIMVGEIRDLETAEIAIKAAQTGHMVMSTLHTNDAPQTLTRLGQMGVPAFNIASAVNLIIAQRLARRLCSNCKEVADIPRETLLEEGFTEEDLADNPTIYHPKGCDACSDGYKGRVGIYQVMPISEEIEKIIMQNGTSLDIGEQALKDGVNDLRRSGILKVLQGVTSLEEVNRVTKE